jgi:hypothetical protein
VLAACCCAGPAGCVNAVRQASETAVPIVVDSGLGELATPRSQAQLKSIAASPAVQEAGYGVGLGIGRGILDEGSAFLGGSASKSDEPAPAVGVAAANQGTPAPITANAPSTRPAGASPVTANAPTTRAAGSGGLGTVEASLSPMIGRMVRSAVTEGLAQATAPEERAQVRAVAEAAGDGFVSGMSRAADREAGPVVGRMMRDRFDPILDDVARRLGPALHDVLQQEVEPVVRDLVAECVRDTLKMPVRPENSPDVIANAHNVSLGAGQGTHDALVNMGILDPSGRWSPPVRLALWGGGTLLALLGLATLLLLYIRIRIAWSQWRRATPPQP